MIRHGSTETARRAVAFLQWEEHHRSLEDERRLTDARIAAAIAALDGETTMRADRGGWTLLAGGLVQTWSNTTSPDTQGMDLTVTTPEGGSVSVRTGPLTSTSPFASPVSDRDGLVRLNRAALSAARTAVRRVIEGDVVRENDPVALRPFLDAACVVTSQVHGEDRERVLVSPRTPFAPLTVTSFADQERTPVEGDRWEGEVRPAFRIKVSHHPNGSKVRFDALLLSCGEVDPMEVMRAHARHAAASATPWWA